MSRLIMSVVNLAMSSEQQASGSGSISNSDSNSIVSKNLLKLSSRYVSPLSLSISLSIQPFFRLFLSVCLSTLLCYEFVSICTFFCLFLLLFSIIYVFESECIYLVTILDVRYTRSEIRFCIWLRQYSKS